MISRIAEKFRFPLIILLLVALIPMLSYSAFAKKKKKSKRVTIKKETVRTEAIKLIRENSELVSELAGLEPMLNDSNAVSLSDMEIGELGEDITELESEDDVTVDLEALKTLWVSSVIESEEEYTESGVSKTELMEEVMEWLGTRYLFGGSSTSGIDCSAFVRHLFMKTSEVLIPRTARDQFTIGKTIKRNQLQFGDLVFFHTRRRVFVSHVGIYLGDNLFAHASSRYGVTISSLESTYYNKRFIGAKRLSVEDLRKFSTGASPYRSNM